MPPAGIASYQWVQAVRKPARKLRIKCEEEKEMSDELNLNELEGAAGGTRHYTKEADKEGWLQHKVGPGDTLIRLAKKYNVPDWKLIRDWNPHIDHKTNMIIDGEYLWIKKY